MSTTDIFLETKQGDAPFFVFADHASNRVAADLNGLGLPEDLLETHIAWDIGAGALARALSKRLRSQLLLCNFSRLVIDANRDPNVVDSIPAVSDEIPVPGNQGLGDDERRERILRFFEPYHDRLNHHIDALSSHPEAFIVSIHSFTKRMMGAMEDRPWDVGLLWRHDAQSARALMSWLRENTEWVVGDNQPYDARLFNYSVDRHVAPRQLRHLTLEIRQDHLLEVDNIEHAAEILSNAIKHVAGNGD
jgi:predicted N-formylglutamate amidohydrolase